MTQEQVDGAEKATRLNFAGQTARAIDARYLAAESQTTLDAARQAKIRADLAASADVDRVRVLHAKAEAAKNNAVAFRKRKATVAEIVEANNTHALAAQEAQSAQDAQDALKTIAREAAEMEASAQNEWQNHEARALFAEQCDANARDRFPGPVKNKDKPK